MASPSHSAGGIGREFGVPMSQNEAPTSKAAKARSNPPRQPRSSRLTNR
jgi:hypothetical protein